jgi:hypothetical protein
LDNAEALPQIRFRGDHDTIMKGGAA